MNGEIDISLFHEKKGQGGRSNTHRAPLLHFFIPYTYTWSIWNIDRVGANSIYKTFGAPLDSSIILESIQEVKH